MPYIQGVERKRYDALIDAIIEEIHDNIEEKKDGHTNYIVSRILLGVFRRYEGYHNYNRMMGVLECIKQELYGRFVGSYEDIKKDEAGDIV